MGNTCYTIPTNEKWLVAILNSHLAEFLICQITNSLRGGFMRLFPQYLEHFPVVVPGSAMQSRLETFVQAGMNGESIDNDTLNGMVYQLYGLSNRETELIKYWFERRSLIANSNKPR